jgi:3-hydroxyacyl-CoA dehydrogenase
MKYNVRRAAVVGAGTMGAAIAAHLANAGVPVTLLDITPEGAAGADREARNAIVQAGWKRCLEARPANLMSTDLASLVTLGNLDDDIGDLAGADWIVEAVLEDLAVKQKLMARVDELRKPTAIVSSNTSGIRVRDISAGRSPGFKAHFLGTHFFNPPRYLKLLEVIPLPETEPEVVDFITWFGGARLGKGVVLCKDTPNFIGNRIASGTNAFAMEYILKNGYTVEEVDAITGPLIGRPKTATFRLIDLVGVDVWYHVGANLAPLIPHDRIAQKYLSAAGPEELFQAMLDRKWLGNKTHVGFYKETTTDGRREFWPLDLQKLEHVAPAKPRFDSVKQALELPALAARLKVMLDAQDRAGELVRALTYQAFEYASSLIPEIADDAQPMDDAMRWGYGHDSGPFELWDALGVAETAERMAAAGHPAAAWVRQMLAAGNPSFYQYEDGNKLAVYDVPGGRYRRLTGPGERLSLGRTPVLDQNAGASLRDLGDGMACLEFHTKMNALDDDIMNMLNSSLDRVERDFNGLVIGSQAENFSAGANVFMIVVGAQQEMWDVLDTAARRLQDLNMRMRYFAKPIVAAPAGLALGGGCEIALHAPRVVAAAETYMGLVETGVGIIPAGGGTKEMLRRLVNPLMRIENAEPLAALQRTFLQIGQARVSTSAAQAREMGLLRGEDRVVMNRADVLAEAKREVLHMAEGGYCPPAPESIFVAGRDALAALRIGAFMFREGRYISPYDAHVADKLAAVLCGGGLTRPQWVSEQYVLDLEREAFLSLCGQKETQARMWSVLQTGRPVRN